MISVRGVAALRRRLGAVGDPRPIRKALQAEAEIIAEAARRAAPVELGHTIEVIDRSGGSKVAFEIGSAHRGARLAEFGTVSRPAAPWLWPAFYARKRGINHKLGQVVAAAFRSSRARGLMAQAARLHHLSPHTI